MGGALACKGIPQSTFDGLVKNGYIYIYIYIYIFFYNSLLKSICECYALRMWNGFCRDDVLLDQ